MTTDKIYLVGFMASGKSTLARALAARLGWQSEDIDDLIERRERKTIAEIFTQHGEPYFRAAEREILGLIRPIRQIVVATGGGTFADPENRAAINVDGLSVWIDLPLADLIPRIPLDGRRPVGRQRPTGRRWSGCMRRAWTRTVWHTAAWTHRGPRRRPSWSASSRRSSYCRPCSNGRHRESEDSCAISSSATSTPTSTRSMR